MTGARLICSASFIASADTWLRSRSMPTRFISATTCAPNGLIPPCFATSVALSAHSVV
jgi:hypothetical protein